jgi:monovalent cation:H+ antiporter-2, CPA2 family
VIAASSTVLAASSSEIADVLAELGAIILVLALLARVSDRLGVSPIPAYLLAGLAFGEGGLVSSAVQEDFIEIAAEIGVVLLLFTLGLEYTAQELSHSLRRGWTAGIVDLVTNATPGVAIALLLGWGPVGATLLGGITYISSSGVVAKVLNDLGRTGNRETPTILTVLVVEDLAMAAYLPIVAVVLAGETLGAGIVSVGIALVVVAIVLTFALRYGHHVSVVLAARTDEALLLGVLGLTLLVAGAAQAVDVSAGVGAFLVGIALSGTVQERASALIGPLRDLFAATFFLLFSLRIDVASLPPMLLPALGLAIVTALSKVYTGWWAAGRAGVGPRGRLRAGTALIARGEFSIVIAGLAVGTEVDQDIVPMSAAYVLLLAILGPLVTRYSDRIPLPARRRAATAPA